MLICIADIKQEILGSHVGIGGLSFYIEKCDNEKGKCNIVSF